MEPLQERKLIHQCAKRFRKLGFDVVLDKEVIDGRSQFGKTDLIAEKGNVICEIECKYINKTNATKKRKKVREQALNYASLLKYTFTQKIVKAYTFTNEGLEFLGEISEKQSKARVRKYFVKVGLRF